MKLRQINLILFTIGLTGCSLLGPNYIKPNINAPQNWNSLNSGTATKTNNIAKTQWWTKFNDPVLNNMINEALNHNNNIQMAIGNIYKARAQLEKAHAQWIPTINVGGTGIIGQAFNQNIQYSNPMLPNVGINGGPQNFNAAAAGFMASYSLNIFQIIKGEDMAKLNVKMQIATKDAVRLTVISQIVGGYFHLLGLKNRLILQEQMIADATEMRKYAVIKQQDGTATAVNIHGLDQFIASLTAQLPSIKNSIVQTQNALLVLMNKNPETITTKNNFATMKTNDIIPVNLPSEVLKNRPDIMVAEYQLEITNAKIGFSKSAFFPSINLTTPIGTGSAALGDLFHGSSDFWSAQLVATMPLLNAGLLADIKASKADYYFAYYNYIDQVRGAFAQVDDGLSQNQMANDAYQQQQVALNAAKEIYQLNQVSVQNGAASYSDSILYKLNVDYSKINLNTAQINKLDSIVNMYQVLGGGYNVNNTESATLFHDSHDA